MRNLSFFLSLLFIVFLTTPAISQDSLTVEQLQPLTFTFQIENGQLTGKGAEFLMTEMTNAQFTMIGEYHGSTRISELTAALIPILDRSGYKTMVLEVGPASGNYLNTLDQKVTERLYATNEKYKITEEDGYVNLPIPFFENKEDAAFVELAKKANWQIMGIDQEYFYGYQMLLDQLLTNLPDAQQSKLHGLYQQVSDTLTKFYELDMEDGPQLAVSIKNSSLIEKYLEKVAVEPANVKIIDAFRASVQIYWLYATRQWYENNGTRINYMKKQLRLQLQGQKFDLAKDKLLIKMGGYHLSKGYSPLAFYEVGNTLNELAAFHGNSALNITFSNRFYTEDDGTVVDILASTSSYSQRYKDFNRMGKKEEWVVIDLRPLAKGHFYHPVKYKFNTHIEDLIKRYDLLIIPRTEILPTPNYRAD